MTENNETRIVGNLRWTYRSLTGGWEGPCGLSLKYVIKEDLNGSWVLFDWHHKVPQDMGTRSARQAMVKTCELLASSLPFD